MKLKTLKILGYKNIKNITLDFSANNGVSLLVGNNGCGKSNILEAISAIFAGLYKDKFIKPVFDYSLSYEINDREINISLANGRYTIKVDSSNISKSAFTKDRYNLPSNIISCYSGESNRLWEKYYRPYYEDYIDNVKTSEITPRLSLIYINKYTLDIALLTLFYHNFDDFTDLASFCNETLGIKSINKIAFDFNTKKIKEWSTNLIINLVQAICGADDASKIPFHYELNIDDFRNRVSHILNDGKELFSGLFGATMPKEDKIITGINLECELADGSFISVDDLSEGEKKEILITTILEVLADENSLILFDEPDSHVHVTRKRDLKVTLDKYINKRESVLTTHSPSLASAFDDNHIIGLGLDKDNKTKIIDKPTAELVNQITNGIWNVHQQIVFLSSNKPITLLVEGETDKIIIEQAFRRFHNKYPTLNFDVFHCNGAGNIPHLLIGLRTSDIKWGNKIIVAIFDNDEEGKDCCNKTQVKYKGDKNKQGFYAITLPKENSTIENFFPDSRFNDSYYNAFRANSFSGSIKDFSKKILCEAKIILSDDCKNFDDSDFSDFDSLFRIIEEIADK